jgi:simple sugar transport system ATP-binding protein
MQGIVKRFPGVLAVDHVDFDVKSGEVHALLGENGAGKSTLMKILYGLYHANEGQIYINGQATIIRSPTDALRQGIGMIHQHFMLVPSLTVAENVALGLPSSRGLLLDLDVVSRRITELSEIYGLQVNPKTPIWQLAVGEQQRVEILRALYRGAELLILDEPTAVLTPLEVDDLFKIFRQMTEDGHSLIFISHKLHEVLAISDRITVLRDGNRVDTIPADSATKTSLAQMMVGRPVVLRYEHTTVSVGEPRMQLAKVNAYSNRGDLGLKNVSLTVRSGEIVGLAGVSGNGQHELAQVVAGLRPVTGNSVSEKFARLLTQHTFLEKTIGSVFDIIGDLQSGITIAIKRVFRRPIENTIPTTSRVVIDGGTVQIRNHNVTGKAPDTLNLLGLSHIPEERMEDGVIKDFSVAENLILQDHSRKPYAFWGIFLNHRGVANRCKALIREYDIKTPSHDTPIKSLSGGNIQKLVLARELSRQPQVLIAAQPTRGVDIGAMEHIHRKLLEEREKGTAILLISEDLDEILSLSDRIVVMYEGEIVGELSREEADVNQLGLMMAGATVYRDEVSVLP